MSIELYRAELEMHRQAVRKDMSDLREWISGVMAPLNEREARRELVDSKERAEYHERRLAAEAENERRYVAQHDFNARQTLALEQIATCLITLTKPSPDSKEGGGHG